MITPRRGIFLYALARYMILCQVIRAGARARVRARKGQRAGHTGPARTGLKVPPQGGNSDARGPRRDAGASAPAPLTAGGQVCVLRRLSAPLPAPFPPCPPPSPASPLCSSAGALEQISSNPNRGGRGPLKGGSGRSGPKERGRPRGAPRRGPPPSPRRLCNR